MVLVQKQPFFQLVFLGIIGQENVFFDILERKNAFVGYKNRSSKSRKIAIFPKGLTHGFGPKIAIYTTSFFQVKEIRKMSFTIFQNEKTPIQVIKTRRSKSRKIALFPKGLTHSFNPKMAIFPTSFFFWQYRPGKCLLRYPRTKNPFLGYKNKKFKKSKNCHYSKGVNPWFWNKNGHFSNLFFQAKQARKMSFTIFQDKKKCISRLKKQEDQKVENLTFLNRG